MTMTLTFIQTQRRRKCENFLLHLIFKQSMIRLEEKKWQLMIIERELTKNIEAFTE